MRSKDESKSRNGNNNVFIKMDREDALESRKGLLEISESAIKLQLVSKKVREVSKKELKDRKDLKKSMKEIASEISKIENDFPNVEDFDLKSIKKSAHRASFEEEGKKPHHGDEKLKDELLEIRRKLEGLEDMRI